MNVNPTRPSTYWLSLLLVRRHPICSFAANKSFASANGNFNVNTFAGFQRAVFLSYGGCAIAVVMAVPATLFGAVAKATDWTQTEWGHEPTADESSLVLPLCLQVSGLSYQYDSNLIALIPPPPLST